MTNGGSKLGSKGWRPLDFILISSAPRSHTIGRGPQDLAGTAAATHSRRHREPAAPPPASMSCYSATWEEFESSAQALYDLDPAGTRYTIQYNHGGHAAVMKVTDDKQVFKFRALEQAQVTLMEGLNSWFFAKMCGRDPATVVVEKPPEAKGGGGGKGKSKKGKKR